MTSRYRFVIEGLICSMLVLVGLLWIAPGPLFSLISAEYGINRTLVGLTTSIMSLAMGAASVPAGILSNKIGLRKSFTIGAFLMSAGLLTPFAANIALLIAIRIIIAIGVAMMFPIASGIVMQWFRHEALPVVNGINISATSIGNSMALFLTVAIAGTLGWKMTLTAYGALTLLFALAWLFLGREVKKNTVADTESAPINIGSILRRRETLLLGLCVAGPFTMFMGLSSWLPSYYHEAFGMSLEQGGFVTGLAPLFGIPACILGGILPLRMGVRKPFLFASGAVLVVASFGTFLFNIVPVIYVSVALTGMALMFFQPTIFTIVMELPGANPKSAALVIAAAWAIGNVAGFFGPVIIGALMDATGSYVYGLTVCAIASVSLFAVTFFLPETGPKALLRKLKAVTSKG